MGILNALNGYKTYIQLIAMSILAVGQAQFGWMVPDIVYMLLGLGSAATAKMKLDAVNEAMSKKK